MKKGIYRVFFGFFLLFFKMKSETGTYYVRVTSTEEQELGEVRILLRLCTSNHTSTKRRGRALESIYSPRRVVESLHCSLLSINHGRNRLEDVEIT